MSTTLAAVFEAGTTLYTVPVIGLELGQTRVTAVGVGLILLLILGSGFFRRPR